MAVSWGRPWYLPLGPGHLRQGGIEELVRLHLVPLEGLVQGAQSPLPAGPRGRDVRPHHDHVRRRAGRDLGQDLVVGHAVEVALAVAEDQLVVHSHVGAAPAVEGHHRSTTSVRAPSQRCWNSRVTGCAPGAGPPSLPPPCHRRPPPGPSPLPPRPAVAGAGSPHPARYDAPRSLLPPSAGSPDPRVKATPPPDGGA